LAVRRGDRSIEAGAIGHTFASHPLMLRPCRKASAGLHPVLDDTRLSEASLLFELHRRLDICCNQAAALFYFASWMASKSFLKIV
jgi:hypothetical protein